MDSRVPKDNIELEWHYTPQSYFEERVVLEREGYSIEINAGRITAKMTADVFESQPSLDDSLSKQLNDYFLGAQPIRRQPFEIQGGAITRVRPDGRRDTTIGLGTASMNIKGGHVDLVYTDQEGRVHDTRRDRIDAAKTLAERSVRHATDQTAHKMLGSFDAAVRDPDNELVHLYEVWDALREKFGDDTSVKEALGISSSARSRLGQLANDEPLNQGRHRGRHAGSLRDATAEEMDEARGITRDMIAAYLKYLDK
jgi:hypothetical protein